MANPSRRLFDLDEAARLSRVIVRRSSIRARSNGVKSPGARPGALAPERAAMPQVRSDRASNATELWCELLRWCCEAFECTWAFALDDRGFMIATTEHENPLPPEVFSEVNAAMVRLVQGYLPEGHRLRSVSLDFAPLGPVSLVPLNLDDTTVLLGLWGREHVESQTIASILRTFSDELYAFEQESALAHHGAGGASGVKGSSP